MFLARIIHEGSAATHRYRYRRRLLLDPSDITAPPAFGHQSNGDASFDGNMVIILAALLCALLCALGLNSIVRCFLQCSTTYGGGSRGRETPDEAAARLAATGVKKEALSRIPVVVYTAVLHVPATDCPICLGEFVEGEDVRFFPRCNHGFHVKCIDRWLVLHSSCPTCRQPLIGHSSSSSADHATVAEDVDVGGADGADVGVGSPRPPPSPSSSSSSSSFAVGHSSTHAAHIAHIIRHEAPLIHGGGGPKPGSVVVRVVVVLLMLVVVVVVVEVVRRRRGVIMIINLVVVVEVEVVRSGVEGCL